MNDHVPIKLYVPHVGKMAVICVREISLLMYGCYGHMLPWMLVVAMDAHCLLWLCVVEVINTQYRKNKNLTTTQVKTSVQRKLYISNAIII